MIEGSGRTALSRTGSLATTVLALVAGAGCANGGGFELGTGGTPTATYSHTPTGPTPSTGNENGAGEACPHTTDKFSFQINGDGPGGLGCGVGFGTLGVSATVTKVDPDLAYMELSAFGPGCTGILTCTGIVRLYIGSLDFTLPIIPGADVSLVATVSETPYGCSQTLAVVNLPNAHYPQSTVWFAGADGTLDTPLDGQIQAQEARGCGAGSRPGFVDASISISIPAVSPDTVTLAGGDLHVIPGTTWAVKNLRSFRPDGAPAGDMRDFAFWAAYEAPPTQ
jgi:hypothetical protein